MRDTHPLRSEQPKPDTGTLQPAADIHTAPIDLSWAIRFHVNDQEIPYQMRLSEKVVIGRSDAESNFMPEIDLLPFNAIEGGVSRRHAILSGTTEYLLVMDLGSTNGTRLNGHRLRPNEPYRLDDGDTLTIGDIHMSVEFDLVPIHEGVKMAQTGRGTGSLSPLDEQEEKAWLEAPILIVEDDQSVAQLLTDFLEMLNYKSHKVHRVGDAMRFIATQVPRAVLLDLRMPDFNGIEVCKMLRADLGSRRLPIIVMSGASTDEEVQAVLDAGADVFLSKPVGLDELLKVLEKYVGRPNNG